MPGRRFRSRTATGWALAILVSLALFAWDHYDTRPGHPQGQRPVARGTQRPGQTEAKPHPAGPWVRLDAVRLVENRGNDGDSFLFRHADGENRFRLYFIDTPEKSDQYPDRLEHQARYFGVPADDHQRIMAAGKTATTFTLERLRHNRLEVWTRHERVMDSERLHAMVRFPDLPDAPWLDALLVSAGLARVYGMPSDLPDGTPKAAHTAALKTLEAEAKAARRGLWDGQKPARP